MFRDSTFIYSQPGNPCSTREMYVWLFLMVQHALESKWLMCWRYSSFVMRLTLQRTSKNNTLNVVVYVPLRICLTGKILWNSEVTSSKPPGFCASFIATSSIANRCTSRSMILSDTTWIQDHVSPQSRNTTRNSHLWKGDAISAAKRMDKLPSSFTTWSKPFSRPTALQ